ncbi:MAG: ROK family protein [Candidatus Acidiferrales bacterium]
MAADSFSIGVDLGGTNLRTAAYAGGAEFLETIALPTRLREGRDAVVADMCGAIQKLATRWSKERRLTGVGIAVPGPLELPAGRLRNPPNLPGWDGLDLRRAAEGTLRMPVEIECDANVAALAECALGKGKTLGLNSLCMLTLGTGVGNGIIWNGRVWHGMNGMAGEAGHATVWPDGHICGCGNHGCLEQYASATAVRRMAQEMIAAGKAPGLAAIETSAPEFAAREVARLAAAGDADAKKVFDLVGRSIGIELAALINTLNFPLYVIGGGLAKAWDLFAPAMFAELQHRSYVYRLTDGELDSHGVRNAKTFVEPAELGPDAGLLGSCILGGGGDGEKRC